MITITPTKTNLEINLERVNSPLTILENNIKSAIHNLNESFNNFWNLSDEEINEIFSYHGIEGITGIFDSHLEHSNALNKILLDRGISEPRAITTKPRDITTVDGVLKLVPLPVAEELIDEIVIEPSVEEQIL